MINNIIEMVFKPGSGYDKTLDNLMFKYKVNTRKKGELISIISMNWLERPTKIIEVYKKGGNELLKYYNRSIVNQITGYPQNGKGGSEFNLTQIKEKNQITEKYISIVDDSIEDVISHGEYISERIELLFECIENSGLTLTEKNIFLNYIRLGMNYDTLSKCYGKSRSYVYKQVGVAKKKVLEYHDNNK